MKAVECPIIADGMNSAAIMYFNAFLRTVLGPRTSGRILNLGAVSASSIYRYADFLNNSEYHTLEPSAETNPTYVGDIQRMPAVPTASYDWVMSVAVLEHVPNMQAAAAEIARVTKADGQIFMSIPARFEMHWDFGYWDYWRVTPLGIANLFEPAFHIDELVFWGDSIADPTIVSIVARKGNSAIPPVYRFYEIDGGYDRLTEYIDGGRPFLETINVWRLNVTPTDYVGNVSAVRREYYGTTEGCNITTTQADKLVRVRLCTREASIIITNGGAEYRPMAG